MKTVMLALWMLCGWLTPAAAPAQAGPAGSLTRMPIKEVTVFKDGHAFVVHQGRVPVDAKGHVVLDRLPTPVLGTFWPYSADHEVKLTAVTASRRSVRGQQTAIDLRGLLEANPGATVDLVDLDGKTISGRIRGLPARPVEELLAMDTMPDHDLVPAKGGMVLLETDQGVLALPLDRLRSVSFRKAPESKYPSETFRNLLTLDFAWPDAGPRREIEVGMAYVQRGLRWIPSYKVTIGATGKARVQLQGTLVNELADLDDVTANLVVGVPTFAFRGTVDPMALQQKVAQLGDYFDARSASGVALSNAVMAQVAVGGREDFRLREENERRNQPAEAGPEVESSEPDQDLYVFTVKRVTLKKGERMVLPVAEYELGYRDVYVLDLPFAPPMEVRANANDDQQRQLARLLGTPHFVHVLRLKNAGHQPLTTAPALISSGDRVLGQGMMSYTAPGADCDLGLTTAVDIKVAKTDKETGRAPNALTLDGSSYLRVDLTGSIAITNRRDQPVDIEVKRSILGHAETAGQAGKVEMVNAYEEGGAVAQPFWWGWYGWPGWWGAVNGVGQFTWKTKVEPGKKLTLTYKWHYFWR
jgi:hypothetical protein